MHIFTWLKILSKRKREKLEIVDISKIYSSICCSRRCITYFSPNDIKVERERLVDKNEQEMTTWIGEKVRTSRDENGYTFNMGNNRLVCLSAWCSILAISSHKIKISLAADGNMSIHGNFGVEKNIEWKNYLRGKLAHFFAVHADTSPTSSHLFLPPTIFKNSCLSFPSSRFWI